MKIERIAVGPLETNCYCVSDKGAAFIVDPGDDYDTIKAYLDKNSFKVDFVLLTHGHADHIKDAQRFGAPVFIHKEDKVCLYDASYNLSAFVGASFTLSKDHDVREVKDGDVIEWKGRDLKVIHTPGHSRGGICALMDGHLFSGDTLFRFSIGRTDLVGGNHAQLLESISSRLFVLPDSVKVYPGHGETSTIGEEKKLNPFMNA